MHIRVAHYDILAAASTSVIRQCPVYRVTIIAFPASLDSEWQPWPSKQRKDIRISNQEKPSSIDCKDPCNMGKCYRWSSH